MILFLLAIEASLKEGDSKRGGSTSQNKALYPTFTDSYASGPVGGAAYGSSEQEGRKVT